MILILLGTLASWVPYYDLVSCRVHLLIGVNFFSLVEFLTWVNLIDG